MTVGQASNKLFVVGPDLDPNCLQRLSAEDTGHKELNDEAELKTSLVGKCLITAFGSAHRSSISGDFFTSDCLSVIFVC